MNGLDTTSSMLATDDIVAAITSRQPNGSPSLACEHLILLLSDPLQGAHFIRQYAKLTGWSVNSTRGQKKTKKGTSRHHVPSCGKCSKVLARPFICLACSYFGCWNDDHISSHLDDTGHDFAVDVHSGALFCQGCEDLVQHPQLNHLRRLAIMREKKKRLNMNTSKRQPIEYRTWVPNEGESSLLVSSTPTSCQGRKGLLNLGATCYLNVVLQSLVHNPLLRSFFLSDKHPTQLCGIRNCLSCEMDKLLTNIYDSSTAPLAPTSFLRSLWMACPELAGYQQHDAHEVLIALLNQIHCTTMPRPGKAPSPSSSSYQSNLLPPPPPSLPARPSFLPRDSSSSSVVTISNTPSSTPGADAERGHGHGCACPVHTIFGAQLQSDVRCGRCGSVNSTVDPMLDLSLDLRVKNSNVTGEVSVDGMQTLAGCLRRFTAVEKLGEREQVFCATCSTQTLNATKRLSIQTLPPVLCIQFKRFEQTVAATSVKVDTPVRFPSVLDMAQYTSFAMDEDALDLSTPSSTSSDTPAELEGLYLYDLFSVVVHEGSLDTGHYTNFARYQDEWYRFDDEKVGLCTLGDALKSRAYICFYVRRNLEYQV